MKAELISPVRGMHDILPGDIAAWQRLEKTAAACFESYGYRELRTPLLERLELFRRQLGEASDIVQKEMYSFADKSKGGEEVALRPEATVSTVRAVASGALARGGVARVWYGGAMFRRERPQKGRQRQFHQLGAEALGRQDAALDAEQIIMQARLWRELGVADALRLEINNLGAAAERQRYRDKLAGYLRQHEEALDADSRQRIATNPLRVLDSKDAQTQKIVAQAPVLADALGDESRCYVDEVREKLAAAGIAFAENPRLVRGLDYYNLTVYEWVLADDARRQNAVCGGGRYDGLAESIGGGDCPGCGFALGMERVLALMPAAAADGVDCFLALADGSAAAAGLADSVAERCRDGGLSVWRHVGGGSLARQLKKADAMGAALAIIVGEEESAGGHITLKRLKDAAQRQVSAAQAAEESRRLLDA